MAEETQTATGAPVSTFILLEDYKSRNNGQEKVFQKGESIVGFKVKPTIPVGANPATIRIDSTAYMVNSNGFMFPASILRQVPAVQVDKDTAIVGQTKKIIKTTGFKQGAVIGIVLGAGYGFFNNRSVFFSAMVGMLAGGTLGHFFFSKNTDKKPVTA